MIASRLLMVGSTLPSSFLLRSDIQATSSLDMLSTLPPSSGESSPSTISKAFMRSRSKVLLAVGSLLTKEHMALNEGLFSSFVLALTFSSRSPNLCSLTRSKAFTSIPLIGSVAWWEYIKVSRSYKTAPPVVLPSA